VLLASSDEDAEADDELDAMAVVVKVEVEEGFAMPIQLRGAEDDEAAAAG
jgi:hypothetical protein